MSRFMRNAPPADLPGKAGSSGAGGCKYFLGGFGLAALGVVMLAVVGIVVYVLLNGLLFAPSTRLELAVPGPAVVFQEPVPGARLAVGESLLVFATARDQNRVTRVDLWIDDQLAIQQSAPDPNGVTPFSLIHNLVANKPGTYALLARAYNGLGMLGESTRVYVTVFDQPSVAAIPRLADYVVQPGDTPADVAEKLGIPERDLREANPEMEEPISPGEIIAVPAFPSPFPHPPASVQPDAPGLNPVSPSGQAEMISGQPGQLTKKILPGLIPGADRNQVLNPPNARVNAPDLQKADTGNCAVTLTWVDHSNNETNFAVFRRGKQQIEKSVIKVLGANETKFVDTVSAPGTYEYTVAAVQLQGTQIVQAAYSNPRNVWVLPAPNCVQTAVVKQVFFRPVKFEPADGALWFNIGGSASQRIPADQARYGVGGAAALPLAVEMHPSQPIVLQMRAAAPSEMGVVDLGGLVVSHSYDELTRQGGAVKTAAAGGFSLTYELWIEDVFPVAQPAPGTPSVPPTALPTAASATRLEAIFSDLSIRKPTLGSIRLFANGLERKSEFMVVNALAYNLKDVFLDRAKPNHTLLVNLAPNDSLQLGFNVGHVCQSQDLIIKPPAEGWRQFDKTYSLQSKDGTCAGTVQVKPSALGAAPPPQSPLPQLPTLQADIAIRNVHFRSGGTIEVELAQISVWKELEYPWAVPLSLEAKWQEIWPCGALKLCSTDRKRSRSFEFGVSPHRKPEEITTIRFESPCGSGELCRFLSVKAEMDNSWSGRDQYEDPNLADNEFSLSWKAGELGNGQPCSVGSDCKSGQCADGRICSPKDNKGQAGEYCHHDNHCATGLCLCPAGWEGGSGFCKGWQQFTVASHGTCSAKLQTGANCTQDKDCASGYCGGGKCTAKLANGSACTQGKECKSDHCADGKKCAPVDGTGLTGAYCHHDAHCADGNFCLCPSNNSRTGLFGAFCAGWMNFDPKEFRGTCTKR